MRRVEADIYLLTVANNQAEVMRAVITTINSFS